jgi:NADH:ubiquinone oxidoreductase subunit
VGMDAQGNRYYEDKKQTGNGKHRRWVLYKGRVEASKVPAQWHGWLHYSTSALPEFKNQNFWEKEHLPNLTGTSQAHQPAGLRGALPKKDYDAWNPPAQ